MGTEGIGINYDRLGRSDQPREKLLEAESMILGAVLLEPQVIEQLTLGPEHFTQGENRQIFSAMRALESKKLKIDMVMLVEELGDQIENAGGVSYLVEVANSCPTAANLDQYEQIVLKYYQLGLIRKSAHYFLGDFTPEAAAELYKTLIQYHTIHNKDKMTKDELLLQLYESLYEQKTGLPGVDTGFETLNGLTGGWKEGELIILAARPSMGKTALAIQLAWECASRNGISLVFSLEMSAKQIFQRLLCSLSGINMMKWHNPHKYLSMEEMGRMQEAMNNVYKAKLTVEENGLVTLMEIRQHIMNLKREHPTESFLVVIDYLQLITVKERFDRHDLTIGYITKQLKSMAKEFKIPIILLSQLSRGVESRADKRPRLSDLRDSGNIEQDADLVLFLYRDAYYDSKSEVGNEVEVNIAKNRNGPVGMVRLGFEKEVGRFWG
ncbi:replicative DNA helicase [Bacillus sp. AG4(2022)]|uniref:replicative DNA helicase n=1 Tax=Bacillus sp. AG4(2022) TaxID=2962594 RepID=UPI002880E274|nr:replicative DNA helicase [Bacillus sp. AG4(2022)]MDT0160665.1 replicative DNA helicase [Bacillus sp. AG4(2022)]